MDYTFSYETIGEAVTITEINFQTWKQCHVEIPEQLDGKSVVDIKAEAFKNTSQITSVDIPGSIKTIQKGVFQGCKKLTKVSLGEGVEEIGELSFSGCPINNIIIPNTIKQISGDFFGGKQITLIYKLPINISNYQQSIKNLGENVITKTEKYLEDFLGFTFNGKHSLFDLKVLRVINGDRFTEDLAPQLNDITADVPNGDGQYYFSTTHKSKNFSIEVAFDSLSEEDFRKWRQFCNGKEVGDLIFDENPYKVYTAKITGTPQLKYICFDQNGQRVYKGEGTIQFTAYWPYAHTPNTNTKVSSLLTHNGTFGGNGKKLSNYIEVLYPTKNEWAGASGLSIGGDVCRGENPGDIPTHFIAKKSSVSANTSLTVCGNTITIKQACANLQWNSKTGIVKGIVSGKEVLIPYDGNGCGTIPVGSASENGTITSGITLEYDYWYY